MSFKPPAPVGFLDALRDGVILGWARDPEDEAAVATVRLMRGMEVLVESAADVKRADGMRGFRLHSPVPVTAHDLLEGRMRVRVSLPSRPAPVTLAMTQVMRARLEAEAGWEPTAEPPAAPPPKAAPPPQSPTPPPPPPSAPTAPAMAVPPPPPRVAPQAEAPSPSAPLLQTLLRLTTAAEAAGVATLHLVLPGRAAVLSPDTAPGFDALEAEAARRPALARDWVPLRAAFGHDPNPGIIWRADGRRLSVEGGVAMLRVLLAVLRARFPGHGAAVARCEAILARAELPVRPRRDLSAGEGPAFLGVPLRETEPVLDESIFFDLPSPALLPGLDGIEAWSSRGAPLPWRLLLLAEPGLGGSAGPASPGWWLRYLAAECIIAEALPTAPPEAALAVKPGLVLTLAAAG